MSEFTSPYNDSVRAEQCYFCPTRHNLHTHHIVPQRMNGSDRRENLVIVCERCHKKLESLYDKRFYERLGLSDDRGKERSHYACHFPDCTNAGVVQTEGVRPDLWRCEIHAAKSLAGNDDWRENIRKFVGDDFDRLAMAVKAEEFANYREFALNSPLQSMEVDW